MIHIYTTPDPPKPPWYTPYLGCIFGVVLFCHVICAISVAEHVHNAGHGWALTILSFAASFAATWTVVYASVSFVRWFFTRGGP